jgi:fumarate reductase subunit C
MSERRPFHRPQPRNWWAQKRYLAYTVRELSGVAVAIYGAVLLAGLICLWRGPEAYAAYQRFLGSSFSFVLHLALLAVVLWHVLTWFQILPKTMPKLILRGQQLPQPLMTRIALRAAAVCSVGLLIVAVVIGALS